MSWQVLSILGILLSTVLVPTSYADLPREIVQLVEKVTAPEPKERDYDDRAEARGELKSEMEKLDRIAIEIAKLILARSNRSEGFKPTRSAVVVLEHGLVKNKKARHAILDTINDALPPAKEPVDPCQGMCRLAEKSANWLSEQSLSKLHEEEGKLKKRKTTKEDIEQLSTGHLSLAALFILRAAPYCVGLSDRAAKLVKAILVSAEKSPAKEVADTSKKEFLNDLKGTGVDSEAIERARNFMKSISSDVPIQHVHALYAKNYLLQLAWEGVDQKLFPLDDVSNKMRELYEGMRRDVSAGLKDVQRQGISGSLFTTFAVSSAVLTMGSDHGREGTAHLDAVRASYESPTNVPYYPVTVGDAKPYPPIEEMEFENRGHRSSASRAVVLQGARWQNSTGAKRVAARSDLMEAIRNFSLYVAILRLHAQREEPTPVYGWHVEGGEIAPYFFYPGIAYCLALIRALLGSGEVSKAEIGELEKTRGVLTGHLTAMLEKNGLFRAEADTTSIGDPKVYANPLGGFGFMSVAKQCKGKPVTALGILLGNAQERSARFFSIPKERDKSGAKRVH